MSAAPELKLLPPGSIPLALEKAERYRLLNEPQEAESICSDILRVDPQNREARIALLLSLTDQFPTVGLERARQLLAGLGDPYAQAYYAGVIDERWGKAQQRPGGGYSHAESWVREAMTFYAQAEKLSPPGVSDAVLRWNACCRFLQTLKHDAEAGEDHSGDDAPLR
jgi:hypothetical protein